MASKVAEPLFRIAVGRRRDPEVAAWFADEQPELRAIAREWFAQMRHCGDDVLELVHDGCPVACVDDAPFAYVDAFSQHVNVGFFRGATLEDPLGLLKGNGKRMRHVKLRPGHDVNADALRKLIKAAYADIKRQL